MRKKINITYAYMHQCIDIDMDFSEGKCSV